jgi:sulfide dehydrogenase [flavocytochrome c] flavoprotein subunit
VRGELSGARTFPAHFANSCWSLIESDDCVKVGGRYEPTPEKIKEIESFVSQPTDSAELRAQNYRESLGWYAGITADMFS